MTSLPTDATRGLTLKILLGMILGVALGAVLKTTGLAATSWGREFVVEGVLHVGGRIFVASLQMLVVPLVFVSLVCGTASLDDIHKLGRVGGRTLALYLFTTASAIALALFVAVLLGPGSGFSLRPESLTGFSPQAAPSLTEILISLVPSNPLRAMAEGNMLQVIVFAILFGIATSLTGASGKKVADMFQHLNEVIMKLVVILMLVAPYGVFCLIAKVFAEQGFAAIVPLAKYFFIVAAVLLLHGLVFYPFLLNTLGGLSPRPFLRKLQRLWLFSFSTSSSNASIPVTLETAEHRLGVHNSIASFTVPLGATVNMDGTAIMQGVATVFIAQAYGIDLSLTAYLMVIVTATLASIGTAGVPGVGLITLAMVLKQVGLPLEGIGLIIGVDRLLDMLRTCVNVTGDLVVSCLVAKSENQLNLDTYKNPRA